MQKIMNNKYQRSINNLKDSLDNWAEITIQDSEKKLVEGMLRGILESSKFIDQFATWLLAGAGATSVLLISNLGSISNIVGNLNYKVTLAFVCIAMIFGVLEKIAALIITIHQAGEKAGHDIALAIFSEHRKVEDEIEKISEPHDMNVKTDINIERVFSMVIDAYPKPFQNYIKNMFVKILNDSMYAHKKSIKIYFWQIFFAIIEILSFILFAASIAVGV